MNSKPLSYDCWKSIISHVDPNKRLLLSLQSPAARSIEKTVPLKLDKLVFHDHRIEVDETVYECEIYQMDSCDEKPPYQVNGQNELNHRNICDVDCFGIPDYITKAGGMLPGGRFQKNLFGERDSENIESNGDRLEKLKQRLSVEKKRYNQVIEFRPKNDVTETPETIEDNYQRFRTCTFIVSKRIYTNGELEFLKNEDTWKLAIAFLKERIDRMEKRLLPFVNKEKNIRPNFEVHLIKKEGNSETVIKRVKYTGDFHNTIRSIWELMFSRRQSLVMKDFKFILEECPIPMPREQKMKTVALLLAGKVTTSSMTSIIDLSSSPLKQLFLILDSNEPGDVDHEFIRTSKYLTIFERSDKILPLILNLVHQTVEINLLMSNFLTNEDFVSLIRRWIETNKPVGTCFTFKDCGSEEEDIIQVISFACEQIDGAIEVNKLLTIPMRNDKELQVRYQFKKKTVKMTVVSLS
uniref:FBA_2 domain-containing protein n=1 Tax=Caenorhabditis tropicalis TaxID=1561998 RepID=A0A1I7TMU9_9PELO